MFHLVYRGVSLHRVDTLEKALLLLDLYEGYQLDIVGPEGVVPLEALVNRFTRAGALSHNRESPYTSCSDDV